MIERIDHAAEAGRLAEVADGSYGRIEHRNGAMAASESVEALMIATVAKVHATLALVEQQRIANLIALGQYRVGPADFPPFRHLVAEPVDEYDVRPTAAIREGLGL